MTKNPVPQGTRVTKSTPPGRRNKGKESVARRGVFVQRVNENRGCTRLPGASPCPFHNFHSPWDPEPAADRPLRRKQAICAIVRKDGGASAYRSMQQHREFPLDGTAETAGAHLPLHRRRGGR